MSEEQASDRDDFDSARSSLLSVAVGEPSSLPTPPNRQSNNKRQLLYSPPPLSSASSHVSSTKSNASESSTAAKKHHSEPTSIYSSVTNKLETLVRDLKTQYEKVPEGHWEKIGYEAADFCLAAIRLAPTESGKEYVARAVGGNDVTPLSCRNFTEEVQAILLRTVHQRSSYSIRLSKANARQILKRDDYYCLISGKRDDYALEVVAGKPTVCGRGYWSFNPLPLAPWFPTEEQRGDFWTFARGIMGDPAFEKYRDWKQPVYFQEHYIVLEPSIRSEFNRYTLSLDRNPGTVEIESPGLLYEVKLNQHSIPQLPVKLSSSPLLIKAPQINPDQRTLLSFHSFVALLLRESAIGKTWVTDPDWNSTNDIERDSEFTIPDDEKDPEEFLSIEELNARSEVAKRENEEMIRRMERNEALQEQDPDREEVEEQEETESFADFFRAFKKEAMEAGSWNPELDVFDRSQEENKENFALL